MQRPGWIDGFGLETDRGGSQGLPQWGRTKARAGLGQGKGRGRASWGGAGLTKLLDGTVCTPGQLKCHVDPAPLVLDPTVGLEGDSRTGGL